MLKQHDSKSIILRYLAVFSFVAAWMICGWLLRLDPNAYLVLGIPLTVLFQRLVRKQPLRALWVREAPPFRAGWLSVVTGILLLLVPLASLAASAVDQDWIGCLFHLACIVGALGAAYSVQHFRRENLAPLALCLCITLALDAIQWSLFFGLGLVRLEPVEGGIAERVAVGAFSLLQYIPVVFVMEEVAFRMLDSHMHEADKGREVLSAILISAIWAMWHLPIGEELSWEGIGILLYVHVPYGVCLSLIWRKTGNLMVPGFCHALGDAIRNMLMAGA